MIWYPVAMSLGRADLIDPTAAGVVAHNRSCSGNRPRRPAVADIDFAGKHLVDCSYDLFGCFILCHLRRGSSPEGTLGVQKPIVD